MADNRVPAPPRWAVLAAFPPRLVTAAAATGGVLLVAICGYALLNAAFDIVESGPVLVGRDDVAHPEPGADVLAWYLPMVAWGPLLLAVTWDFRRRHQGVASS